MPPDIIPSIFNWCDRWCERCAFAERCAVGIVERKRAPGFFDAPEDGEDWLDEIETSLAQTQTMLSGLLQKEGLDPNKIAAAPLPQPAPRISALSRAMQQKTTRYARLTDTFFKENNAFFNQKSRENEQRIDLELPLDLAEMMCTGEAISSLRWFQYFIGAKAQRAICGLDDRADWGDPRQCDGNGSAKICLLAISESLAAWETLHRNFPEKTDEILDLLVVLREIQQDLEAIWPEWRKFHRPGFDDEPGFARFGLN